MKFEDLNDSERLWLHDRLLEAARFAEVQDSSELPSLEALDDAFAAFVNLGMGSNSRATDIILAIGAAFGEHLVRTMGFEWRIATDDWGTDIAVVARPGRGDITIFPTDFVAKRWERKESKFLAAAIAPINQTVQESAAAWGDA